MPKLTSHRATLGEYIRAGRHVISETRAKIIREIAAETGISTTTVRHWLKRDHYDEWLYYWPTPDALWEEWQKDKPALVPMNFDLPDLDPAAIAAAADDTR